MQLSQEFQMVPIGKISESQTNPRMRYSEQAMQELTDSIRRHGILNPLLVRPVNEHFEIVAGSRRYRGAQAADLTEVPCHIKELGENEALELQILENLQREDIHPLDEASGFQALLERPGYDIDALCAKVARSQSYIYQRLKLLDLIPGAQQHFLNNNITAGHALLIARLEKDDQVHALQACFDENFRENGKPVLVGVRQLAGWIQQNVMLDLKKAPFSKTATDLGTNTACVTCTRRTGFVPQLFPDIAKKDTCTYPACFHAKLRAHIEQKKKEYEDKSEKLVEVSTDYYRPYGEKVKASAPVLHSEWKEVSTKDRCDSMQTAIVVAGREDVGRLVNICVDKKCKKHHQEYGGSRYTMSQDEKERRRKENLRLQKEIRVRELIQEHVLACFDTKEFDLHDLEFIAYAHLTQMQSDDVFPILKRHGWELKKGDWDKRGRIKQEIAGDNLNAHQFRKLMMEFVLAPHVRLSYYDARNGRPADLLAIAKHYQVDIKDLEKQADEYMKSKEKKKTAPPKAKKTAKAK